MDVAAWLGALGLDRYARAFAENDIDDADVLRTLGDADLRELGVASLGHRRKLLVALALATDDPGERARALAEAVLAAGCVGHNHLRAYPDAIDAALRVGDWAEAERYAQALEDHTRPEPLPWSDLFAARGRALVAYGRDELERLRDEGERLGYRAALPAIERALAGA